MYLYDENGFPISISTTKKVYTIATGDKVVNLYTRTFEHFYKSLSDKEIEKLWKLAITSLGLDESLEYSTLVPFEFKFLLEEDEIIKPTIWRYLMTEVGYPKYKVVQLDYKAFANKQTLLGFERVYLTKSDAEHDAYDYLLSIHPNERSEGRIYNELDLRNVKHAIFDLDDKKLPIMIFANNLEDTNPFSNDINKIRIRQPKGYLPNQFEITDGTLVYDVMYINPTNN